MGQGGRSRFERPPSVLSAPASVIRGKTEDGALKIGVGRSRMVGRSRGAVKKWEGGGQKERSSFERPPPSVIRGETEGGGQNLRWGGQVLSAPRLLLGVNQRGAVKIEDGAVKF